MVRRHLAADAIPVEPHLEAKAAQRITRLERDATPLRDRLVVHLVNRREPTSGPRKSNRMDIETAKMATSKVVIRGYTGVAADAGDHSESQLQQLDDFGTNLRNALLILIYSEQVTALPNVPFASSSAHSNVEHVKY